MDPFKEKMKERTLRVAQLTIEMSAELPKTMEMQIIKKQLLRSVTSVSANYHASCRAKSKADFINKLHIVEEECDECLHWLKLSSRFITVKPDYFESIIIELNEILAIVIKSIKTTKGLG